MLAASIAVGCLVAQQIGGKALRDAQFLSSAPPEDLPHAMLAAAAASLMAAGPIALALRRFGPRAVAFVLLAISALLYVVEAAFLERRPLAVAWLLFIHIAIFGASIISSFWSVITERFDPHTAKSVMSRIVAGSTLGGVLGGIGAERAATYFTPSITLIFLAVLTLASGPGIFIVGASSGSTVSAQPRSGGPIAPASRQAVSLTRYLITVGALSFLMAVTAALVEYTMKVRAAAPMQKTTELMQIFSWLYVGSALATFLTQLIAGKKVLEKIGLGATLAILPAAIVLGSGASAIAGGLATAAIAAVLFSMLSNSLTRSAYEILYTPVPPAKKRAIKLLIDVASTRAGDALGSGLILLFVAITATNAPVLTAAAAAVLALMLLAVVHAVDRGYVRALAESIRSGLLALEDADIRDATTRRTVALSRELDRNVLLSEIAAIRAGAEEQAAAASKVKLEPPLVEPALAASLEALITGDHRGVTRALASDGFVHHLAPFALEVTVHGRHGPAARAFLERHAAAIAGQLGDAALDRELPFEQRRISLDLLHSAPSDRSVPFLLDALADPSFAIRAGAAETLLEIVRSNRISREARNRVLDRVRVELASSGRFDGRADSALVATTCPALEVVFPGKLDPEVRLIFALLAIALGRERMLRAFRALASSDARLRGTAVEYLENVLRDDLRAGLIPLISASPEVRTAAKEARSP